MLRSRGTGSGSLSVLVRRSRRPRYPASVLLASLLLLPAFAHAVVIDTFETAQSQLIGVPGAPPPAVTSSVVGPGILGDWRDTLMAPTSGSGLTGRTLFEVTGGQAIASVETDGAGQVRLDYDGAGTPFDLNAALGADLTDGGASDRFLFEVASVVGTVNVLVNIGVSGGQLGQTLQGSLAVSSTGIAELAFSSLVVGGGPQPLPDLAFAPQIALFLQMGEEEAITLDAFCTGPAGGSCAAPSSAPEPGTALIFAIGLAGLAAARRRAGA